MLHFGGRLSSSKTTPHQATSLLVSKHFLFQVTHLSVIIQFICLDVANGYSQFFVEFVAKVRGKFPEHTIMVSRKSMRLNYCTKVWHMVRLANTKFIAWEPIPLLSRQTSRSDQIVKTNGGSVVLIQWNFSAYDSIVVRPSRISKLICLEATLISPSRWLLSI